MILFLCYLSYMTRLKAPCFSLGAHGSISDAITYVKRARTTVAEQKPRLPYFLTLPSQYQRWLFQDGIYAWYLLSIDDRQTWKFAASRHHMTGFAWFMRYYLTTLPDITAWWKLDEHAGGVAHDSGPNSLHGAVIGAVPEPLAIDGARHFDGNNDRISFGVSDLLRPTTSFTFETFHRPHSFTTANYIASNQAGVASGWACYTVIDTDWCSFVTIGTVPFVLHALNVLILDHIHHICCVYDSDVSFKYIYIDGVLEASEPVTGTPIPATDVFYLGAYRGIASFCHGDLDNAILWNRVLAPAQIINHASRRYPPK